MRQVIMPSRRPACAPSGSLGRLGVQLVRPAGAVVATAIVALLAACTDDPPTGGTTSPDGGGSSGAASSSSGDAGGSTSSSSSSTSSGGVDASSSSGGGVLTGNGITGTIGATPRTHTVNAIHVPQQTTAVLIGANKSNEALTDKWQIRFKPQLGTQPCDEKIDTENTYITYGTFGTPNDSGTTAKPGSCSITVTSLGPSYEGTFTAVLSTQAGTVNVTDGAFRVPK